MKSKTGLAFVRNKKDFEKNLIVDLPNPVSLVSTEIPPENQFTNVDIKNERVKQNRDFEIENFELEKDH